jgi:pimeloyl-ACP methyl ester carboxylesterase
MQASPKARLDCVRAWSETDFRQFKVPTLVIHGDSDATVPLEKSGALAAKLVPGTELKVYKGQPHGLTHTALDRLNSDLIASQKAERILEDACAAVSMSLDSSRDRNEAVVFLKHLRL